MVSVICLSVTFVHPTQTVKLFGNKYLTNGYRYGHRSCIIFAFFDFE